MSKRNQLLYKFWLAGIQNDNHEFTRLYIEGAGKVGYEAAKKAWRAGWQDAQNGITMQSNLGQLWDSRRGKDV